MNGKRASGVLLHISSLPGAYGIGTLGEEAYRFVDFLRRAGQTYWQILPVCPVGKGNSPYQSFSSFAGNPLFIDPAVLHRLQSLANLAEESTGLTADEVAARMEEIRAAQPTLTGSRMPESTLTWLGTLAEPAGTRRRIRAGKRKPRSGCSTCRPGVFGLARLEGFEPPTF